MLIEFEKIRNVRQLGGISAAGGKKVKDGVLFRSGDLRNATADDRERLCAEFGIKTVIDLRDSSDSGSHPDREIDGALNINIPAFPPLKPTGELSAEVLRKKFDADPLSAYMGVYERLALTEESADAFSRLFRLLLERDGAFLFHCRQGKDRTGAAAVLILSALGAEKGDIIADYMESNLAAEIIVAEARQKGVPDDIYEKLRAHSFVYRQCVDHYFDTLCENYGSVRDYLTMRLGLSENDISRLRAKFCI